jgi:hypothetical protein
MTFSQFIQKVKFRLWGKIVEYTRNRSFYPCLYRSYWHYKFSKSKGKINTTCYFGARPNPGAGIGHQLGNWIAGYWFAKQFELGFAHIPKTKKKWEDFLGFGENELKVSELVKSGYKARTLPLFDENNPLKSVTKDLIQSYAGKKVVFIAEQEQGYADQFGVKDDIKRKFNQSSARLNDRIIYDSSHFNIAIHVRRTVIIEGKTTIEDEATRAMRWLNNDYYENVLRRTLDHISVSKPISIYIFSTGKPEEFAEFSKYGDIRFCSDMDEYTSFLHLMRADLLITSKSSFSYKPALMNEGIRISPRNFWHGYPEDDHKWILAENDGTFEVEKLNQIL